MKYKTTQYKLCNRTQNNSPHIKISHSNRIFSIVSMYTVSRHQISPFFLCSFSMFRFGLIQFFYVPLLKIDLFADIIKKIFSLYNFSMNTKNNPHQYYLMGTLILSNEPAHFHLKCQFCLYIAKEQILFLLYSYGCKSNPLNDLFVL